MPKNTKKKKKLIYNNLPKKVSRQNFNKHIEPCLSKGKRGPKSKISLYKIFNYILYVLHTGIQWDQLKTYKNELHWSGIYARHSRWSKDGSYEKLFASSVTHLIDTDQLDLSILHGDGSNTVVKKGAKESDIRGINIRKAKKS